MVLVKFFMGNQRIFIPHITITTYGPIQTVKTNVMTPSLQKPIKTEDIVSKNSIKNNFQGKSLYIDKAIIKRGKKKTIFLLILITACRLFFFYIYFFFPFLLEFVVMWFFPYPI